MIKKIKALPWKQLFLPIRQILTLLGLLTIGIYFLLRSHTDAMCWIYQHITSPIHSFLSRLCGLVSFSVAEVCIYASILGLLIYLIVSFVSMLRHREFAIGLYRLLSTLTMCFCVIYGGFCLLWGVYYDTASFQEESGISRNLVSVEELEAVTGYFARQANRYGQQVSRDEDGLFCESVASILDASVSIYDNISQEFPSLSGTALRAKPFYFSKLMSYIQFTGFFFPFTAEANINIDSPACLIPATVAHEMAHQRGVAAEDEANFVAVLSSMTSKNPVYCYSAALLAYIHLSNALYKADYDAWSSIYFSLSDEIRADLNYNNTYWAQYETPVSTVSDTVYSGFLQSYGQTDGLKTYGACIDLLISYYYEAAVADYEVSSESSTH